MTTVASVEAKGDKGAAILVMDDQTRVWTPDKAKAESLVGKPIPADWTQRVGDYGPQALPPKEGKGGGAAAWRNTKEGFLAEQAGYEKREERIMRRTALMQAVAYRAGGELGLYDTTALAALYYEWLMTPAPITSLVSAAGDTSRNASPPPPSPAFSSGSPPKSGIGGAPSEPVAGGPDSGVSAPRVSPLAADAARAGKGESGSDREEPEGMTRSARRVGADTSSTDAPSGEGALPVVVGGVGGVGEGGRSRDGEGGTGPPCPKCGSPSKDSTVGRMKGWKLCPNPQCGHAFKP